MMKKKGQKSIVILGLAQNCSSHLKIFFEFIDKIEPNFKKLYLIIGENDSKDNTLKYLKSYKNKKVNYKVINTSLMQKYSHRLERMARGREYLSKKISKYKPDYVAWFDLDDILSGGINTKEFMDSIRILKKSNKLFGVSAISYPYYYDILSLRVKNFFMKNIFFISKVREPFLGFKERKKYVYDVQRRIGNSNILSVSSFNGACIYKFKYYKFSSYVNFNKSKKLIREQVEHVTFNNFLHNKFKKYILINKNLKLKMPIEHFPYDNFISFLFGKFFLMLKKL